MASSTHPLTGIVLRDPDPAPLRVWAMYDADKPCTKHNVAYTGQIPCTGMLRCYLCGTTWNDDGNPETLDQRAARLGGDRM